MSSHPADVPTERLYELLAHHLYPDERSFMISALRRLEAWQWNQYVTAFAIFMTFVAFSFVMPFLAIYLHRELGVADVREVALWTGILFAISPLLGAFSGPLWGTLADRFGHKVMMQRAIFVVSLALGLMALAQNTWHVLILRATIGVFGGINAMGIALLTSIAPREKIGQSVGLLQGARALSGVFAPALGGFLADTVGMRQSFVVSGLLGMSAFVLLTLTYRDLPGAKRERLAQVKPASPALLLHSPAFLAVALVLFFVQAVDTSFVPILPLFVTMLEGSSGNAGTLSGLIISFAAIATAISSTWLGRFTEKRSPRRLLMLSLAIGMALCVPLALSGTTTELFIWRVLLGLCAGGTITLAYTLGGAFIPPEIRGSGFGLLTSATLMGSAISPLLFGALAGFNLRWVFGLDAVIYGVVLIWVFIVLRRAT